MENKKIPKIPIIGLTAFTSEEDKKRGKNAGMLSVLSKPLSFVELEKVLSKINK